MTTLRTERNSIKRSQFYRAHTYTHRHSWLIVHGSSQLLLDRHVTIHRRVWIKSIEIRRVDIRIESIHHGSERDALNVGEKKCRVNTRARNFPPARKCPQLGGQLSPDQRALARMRVPQLAAEITRNKKLDRVSHVHARPPSTTSSLRGSPRRECGSQPA